MMSTLLEWMMAYTWQRYAGEQERAAAQGKRSEAAKEPNDDALIAALRANLFRHF